MDSTVSGVYGAAGAAIPSASQPLLSALGEAPQASTGGFWPRQGRAESTAHDELFAGRYRIDSVLGTGGMGVVYAAMHVDLGLPVAIKLLHPSLAGSSEARARFTVEARAMAALKSPHVVRVYDAGELETQRCFVVMERLEGCNLDQLLRAQGCLPLGTAVDYVLQACSALREAHGIGLVHRDLKPENLFLAHYRCSGPLIKVMDFGIARWQGAPRLRDRLTLPNATLGSPCYQSPEQLANAADADERSDVWSLGLVLFELLTGQCPFEADTLEETRHKTLLGPRPSLAHLRPDLPAEVDAVLQRCLAPNPAARFSCVTRVAAALSPFAPQKGGGAATREAAAISRTSRPSSARLARRSLAVSRSTSSITAIRSSSWAALAFALGAAVATAAPRITWAGVEESIQSAGARALHHVEDVGTRVNGLMRELLP